MLKRTVWKDKYEITYVGPSQVLVKAMDANERGVIIKSQNGGEIDDVKIMGKDFYFVARTDETLLVVDLQRNLLSEVSLGFVNLVTIRVFYFNFEGTVE